MIEMFGSRHAWGVLNHHNELVANIIMSKKLPSMGHLDPPVVCHTIQKRASQCWK